MERIALPARICLWLPEQQSQAALPEKGARLFLALSVVANVVANVVADERGQALRFRRGLQCTAMAKLDADLVLRPVGRAMPHPAGSQDTVVFRADLHQGGERDPFRIGNARARF
jgi:hypothetical protein